VEFRVGGGAVRVNVAEEAALLAALRDRLRAGRGFTVATLNLDHLVKLRTDPAFRAAYAAADLVTADGNPVVWLSRLAGRPVALLPGADLIRPALALCAAEGAPVGLLGGTDAALAAAAARLAAEVPGLAVAGRIAPPMGLDPEGPEAAAALDALAAQGARVVLLALGAPRQERLAAMGRRRHPAMGFLCIGAGLDFVAGAQARAPLWMRRLALEWLWRMATDPRRLAGRYARCALILPGHAARALAARRTAPSSGPRYPRG
jgi:exopolysaccharide biosynthesis WecB/TagA/CpsF family protein